MGLRLVTSPADEPLTLDEAKAHLIVTHESEDSYIEGLIPVARRQVESYLWRQLVTATYDWTLERLPPVLYVPRPPLQSVVSVKYRDFNGDLQTIDAADYDVDIDSEPGRVVPAFGTSWPTTRGHVNDVVVRFTCGYGSITEIPDAIRHAIKIGITALFEDGRTATTLEQRQYKPEMALSRVQRSLLEEYRVRDQRIWVL